MPRRAAVKEDLTGKVFGQLTVLGFSEFWKRGYQTEQFWVCKCICGTTKDVERRALIRGGTVSCGCYKIKKFVERSIVNNKERALPDGKANFNVLYSRYSYSAKVRGYQFLLTEEEAKYLFISVCFYCGCPPKQVTNKEGCKGDFIYNGIDRLNNSKNYELSNCVPCCGRCNRAKFGMSPEEFKQWVTAVYTHLNTG